VRQSDKSHAAVVRVLSLRGEKRGNLLTDALRLDRVAKVKLQPPNKRGDDVVGFAQAVVEEALVVVVAARVRRVDPPEDGYEHQRPQRAGQECERAAEPPPAAPGIHDDGQNL
jgi:hypothetical protein